MAWQVVSTGTREGVIKLIEAAQPQPAGADPAQLNALRAVLIAEVKALPAECNGVRIDASGDSNALGRHFSVQIFPLKLAV